MSCQDLPFAWLLVTYPVRSEAGFSLTSIAWLARVTSGSLRKSASTGATVDLTTVLDDMLHGPAIENLRDVPGALIWRVDGDKRPKRTLTRIVVTAVCTPVTACNINTVRKRVKLADTDGAARR